MAIISKWAKSIARVLESSFSVSSTIASHSGVLGDARESFIRDVLKRFLPSNISIGAGQIIDAQGGISKQIDLIIYRNDFPTLRTFGSADVYLIEGVIATVEVKSQLNEKSLFEALENGKSVRNLKPSVLRHSLDEYSARIYDRDYQNLTVSQMNSVMGLVLPPAYVYGYRGYPGASLEQLRNSLNSWHNLPDRAGELDVTLMPEVIATQGCVTLKNLNNHLALPRPGAADLEACRQSYNTAMSSSMSKQEFYACFRESNAESFDYGIAIKAYETPLQYLISSLLEAVTSRIGYQQLGGTAIQYNLLKYHLSEEMEGGWSGAAINLTRVRDPKLDLAGKFGLWKART
ncbi:hypothetical protein Q7L38_21815 [Pseudomonas protegens]|uniref:DUF6602 domain-containing protein n=1 Tax=Pseudomonas protegens TaxID=380021 RepID=A0A9Q6IAF3_9PSED|nr:DUF6602 domain-containing protein [Pseudomonas protegens]MDP9535215.1 hypothetical protein [Pseudomonas protegens]PYC30183.1 hypothetical protein DMX08_27975 [Pseudomonas protegens]